MAILPRLRAHFLNALMIATTLAITACKVLDLSGLEEVFSSNLTAIGVTSGGVVEVGDTVRLEASGSVSGLIGIFSYAPILDAEWSVSNPLVARLITLPPPPPEDSFARARVLVQGVQPGNVTVSAQSHGIRGSSDVRVIPQIDRIEVRASSQTLFVGDTIPIAMTAIGSDGSTISDLHFTLEVSGGVKLSISQGVQAVTAVETGPATVTARFRRSAGTLNLTVLSR